MKKTLLALAVLSGFTASALAQSSVTIFGALDANYRYVKNGSLKRNQQDAEGLTANAIGFRGIEDLGGGLKAGFWLESSLNPDDGTINGSGKFWHRRSTVSLISDSLGEVRLGRDLVPTYALLSTFDPFSDKGAGRFSNLQSKLGGTVNTLNRADNEVQYFLPANLGGVYGSVAAAPGEGANAGNKFAGGRIGYAGGPLNVSLAYSQTDANAAGDKYKVGAFGAAYDFGVVRVLGSASRIKFLGLKEDLYIIGVTIPAGPGYVRATAGRANLSGGVAGTNTADASDANLLAIGYVYKLSKRTSLYSNFGRLENKGAQNLQLITRAAANNPTINPGEQSSAFELGVNHQF